MKVRRVLAFDFGASSGRAMLGSYDGNSIKLEEVHRFGNDPVIVRGTMYWDVLRLFYEVKQGILKAKQFGEFESIGVDTWGVDFGIIDKAGRLIENPIHYRDNRTNGMLNKAFELMDKEEFYKITGNQFMEINTAFQLLSIVLNRNDLMERADKILLMPDLINYFLTGKMTSEYSIASTTQLMDAKKRTWSKKLLNALSIPERIFNDIVPTGSKVGNLSEEICNELEIKACEVVAVAGHDTQSAMVAVPSEQDNFIFISCGTWSLFGTELKEPIINDTSYSYNMTNEGGYGNKASFLKNITGLWLIQESRRQWMREEENFSFGELELMAKEAEPFYCFIDPDAEEFSVAGNLPRRIKEYCKRTNQNIPETKAQITRCIYESLALKYCMTLKELKECTGNDYQKLHMVGGGIQSKLLCQMTANACGLNVIAGPVEATVLGNISLQLIALGALKDISEVRALLRKGEDIIEYTPQDTRLWNRAYDRFEEVISC